MTKLIVYVAIFLGAFALLKLLAEKYLPERKGKYRYQRKDSFMTSAEQEFFAGLKAIVGERYQVFAQVHLPTVLNHKVPGQNWRGAFRHIDEKSVDFVICDGASLRPLLTIEFDDRSHGEDSRKLRDEEVNRIFEEAGLPLIRIENHGHFDSTEVSRLVNEALAAVEVK